MPRDYWDFKSGMEDFKRIFERPPNEFDDQYKPDLFEDDRYKPGLFEDDYYKPNLFDDDYYMPGLFEYDYYKPGLFGTSDGVTPKLRAWRRTVEIRPILPPDPPKFIRDWSKRANRLTLDDDAFDDYCDA